MAFRKNKIAVIGAGHTGSTLSLFLAQKELGDVVLVDIPEAENPTKGKALDLLQTGPIEKFNVSIKARVNMKISLVRILLSLQQVFHENQG